MVNKKITWIASYPRSGNTWMRALLTAYVNNGKININGIMQSNDKTLLYYDGIIKKPVQDWSMLEQGLIKPVAMLRMLEESDNNQMLKTHDCNIDISSVAQIPTDLTRAAVYIVRDPRDVTLSFKNHYRCKNNAEAVEMLTQDNFITQFPDNGLYIPQLSWKINVASWTRKLPYPVHIVKYEDMLKNSYDTFSKVVRFLKLEYNEELLRESIDSCNFNKLRKQEKKYGFRESVGPTFFHKGQVERWKTELEPELQTKIVTACEAEMKSLGYI